MSTKITIDVDGKPALAFDIGAHIARCQPTELLPLVSDASLNDEFRRRGGAMAGARVGVPDDLEDIATELLLEELGRRTDWAGLPDRYPFSAGPWKPAPMRGPGAVDLMQIAADEFGQIAAPNPRIELRGAENKLDTEYRILTPRA